MIYWLIKIAQYKILSFVLQFEVSTSIVLQEADKIIFKIFCAQS